MTWIRVQFDLRTPHVTYLKALADRREIPRRSISRAIGQIIGDLAEEIGTLPPLATPTLKVTKHVSITVTEIESLDQLSMRWGLNRSDVLRRLIDHHRSSGRSPAPF